MAKNKTRAVKEVSSALSVLWGIIAWLTGFLVALAVGFGMASGTLTIPSIPDIVTASAGWIVVVLAIFGAVIAIIDKISR